MDAQFGQVRPQSVAAGVLAQDDVAVGQTDVLGMHDLVGGAFLQHPVLVDAGFVGEGILAHDRLVRLDQCPVKLETMRLAREISVVTMLHGRCRMSRRVTRAMATSSRAALPARSPSR